MARISTVGYTPAAGRGRRRPMITTALVVVVAGLLGGAYLLGRATAPSAPASAASAHDGLSMSAGIPVPDRHSPAGAATAAANFQAAGFRVSAGTLDPATASQVLLAADATDTAKQVLQAPATSTEQLSKTRISFAPLSLVIQTYTDTRAVVQVWGVAATSTQVTPQPGGTEDWSRSTVAMTWDGQQWRVSDQQFAAGPWPVRDDQRLANSDGDFAFRYHELPGGWTYVPSP